MRGAKLPGMQHSARRRRTSEPPPDSPVCASSRSTTPPPRVHCLPRPFDSTMTARLVTLTSTTASDATDKNQETRIDGAPASHALGAYSNDGEDCLLVMRRSSVRVRSPAPESRIPSGLFPYPVPTRRRPRSGRPCLAARNDRAKDVNRCLVPRSLGPSTGLRKWFGHDPANWKEFRARYRKKLSTKRSLFDELAAHARDGKLTLVVGARDPVHNQAVVIKKVLEGKRRAR